MLLFHILDKIHKKQDEYQSHGVVGHLQTPAYNNYQVMSQSRHCHILCRQLVYTT